MAYADLLTIQTLNVGDILTAACMTQARNNDEFLINPPACSVYNNTTQSVPNNTPTILTANSERFDNDAMHSTSSSTSRITATTAGRYLFFCTVTYNADIDGIRYVNLQANGATLYPLPSIPSVGSVFTTVVGGTLALTMTAGQYVEVEAYHNAGASLGVTLSEFGATFLTR